VTNKPVATKVSPSVAATTNKVATPPAKTTVTSPKTTTAIVAPASTAGRVKYIHKITTGESLYSIGKKYNVTVSQLKSWNNMVRDMINAGKTLVVWVKKK
jgi:LysM repeat protein